MSPTVLVAINAAAGAALAARGHPFWSALAIAAGGEGIGVLLGRMYPEKFPLLRSETGAEYFANVGVVIVAWWMTSQLVAPYELPRPAR